MGVGHEGVFGRGDDAACKSAGQGEHCQLEGYPALVGVGPIARIRLVIWLPIDPVYVLLILLIVTFPRDTRKVFFVMVKGRRQRWLRQGLLSLARGDGRKRRHGDGMDEYDG